ncbi:MAG: hypothetical protein ACRDSK_19305 [Actinophytocola sp.]|uniref:hypothetical protein n=1 Tax=Actinophytocola sp. TaxID=1872138 RepID=UPI003D6BF7FA
MKRILVVLVTVLTSGLLMTSTAQAGNWAETLLDPTPPRIEPGVTYTFGYWVLQHGSYPYMGGDLGPTALTATDEKGDVVEFAGTQSPTDGHYAAEVVFPHKGTWTIAAKHGVLMSDGLVATVTVPGAVRIAPSEVLGRAPHEWGAVRPSLPPTAPDAELIGPAGTAEPAEPAAEPTGAQPAVAPRSQATADESGSAPPWSLLALAVVATLGLAIFLGRRHVRANADRASR